MTKTWIIGGLLAGAFVWLLVLVFRAEMNEINEWRSFAVEHNCRVVEKRDAQTSTGVAPIISDKGGVAVTTATTPAQTAWLCDDGVTYWKKASWGPSEK